MSARLYIGIDAGSSATKCVALDDSGELIGHAATPSGFDFGAAGTRALEQSLAEAGASTEAIAAAVATGYGRERVKIATRHLTEITCHARGAREWYPKVRTIIDIGGQDTKVIRINDRGQMIDYRMNAKCAAGTGTFLESIAVKLGMTLPDLDKLAMECHVPTVINSYCTVFAGTEVLERIKSGDPAEDIAMGLFRSIASRTFEMISSSADGPVAATGGVVAHCRAMVRALEEILKTQIMLPPLPQFAGAYGAALEAMERNGVASQDAGATRVDVPAASVRAAPGAEDGSSDGASP